MMLPTPYSNSTYDAGFVARRMRNKCKLSRASQAVGFRCKRSHHANATIEMVFILPLLLFLTMGMGEFAQFFYIKSAFQSAARDAARVACTAIAVQTDPAAVATRTLGYSNVTFNASWMTIFNCATASYVTDVSTIAAGQAFTVTIQQTYDQLPNVYRPLYSMTGQGIRNGKLVIGKCTMIKEG